MLKHTRSPSLLPSLLLLLLPAAALAPVEVLAADAPAAWSVVKPSAALTARGVSINTGVLDYQASQTLARVREAYKLAGSIKADFVQTETRTGVSRVTVDEGTLSFLLPDKMLWDYQGKDPHRFVVNGEMVWIYTPSRKQVVKRKMTLEEMRLAGGTFLRGLEGIEQQFDLATGPLDSSGRSTLILTPRKETPFERIEVTVNQVGLLDFIKIRHKIGNVTAIAFNNIQTGVALAPVLFAYDIPEGTEVVEP